MMKNRLFLLVMLTGVSWSQSSIPQGSPKRIETSTRLVAVFSDLNNELFQSIQKHDAAAFNRLVGEDFELRAPSAPDNPKSREDWQQLESRRPLQSFRISQLAVRGLRDDVAIVSFVLEEKRGATADVQKSLFVQAWLREGEAWICQEAYASPIAASAAPSRKRDRRPSGKD
jgi:hypothetical protein